MERCAAGVGTGGGGAIERGFDGGGEGVEGRAVRSARARGWHHAGADFADDFFPGFGVGGDVVEVQFVQFEAAGFEFFVVAGDAVLVEEGLGRGLGVGQGEG